MTSFIGSATVVNDCQKFFSFLPLTYQIDIRTARFLEQSFARQAELSIKPIFAAYGDNIKTVPELKYTVENFFFDGQHGD